MTLPHSVTRTLASCALFLLVFEASRSVRADQIDPVVEGLKVCSAQIIPSELKATHQSDYDAAFRDAICGKWYASHKSSVDDSGGLDIIKVISASGGHKSDEESVNRSEYCRDTKYHVSTSTANSLFIRFLPDGTASAVSSCIRDVMSNNPRPILALGTVTPDGFRVSVRNVMPGNGDQRFASLRASGLKCNDVSPGKIIPATNDGLTLKCHWLAKTMTYGEVTIVSGTTPQTKSSVTVTALRDLPEVAHVTLSHIEDEKIPDSVITRCSDYVDSRNLDGKDCNDDACKKDGHATACTNDAKKHCKLWYVTPPLKKTSPDSDFLMKGPQGPRPDCQTGGCRWSAPAETFHHIQNPDGSLSGTAALGSLPCHFRFCVDEQLYKHTPKVQVDRTWRLTSKTASFIVDYPENQNYTISVSWAGPSGKSGNEALPPGKELTNVRKVNSFSVSPTVTQYTYRLDLH